jgi:hypothetical protein
MQAIVREIMRTPEGRRVAREIGAAGTGDVRYLEIRQPIGTRSGEAVLRDIEVKEFDLTTP